MLRETQYNRAAVFAYANEWAYKRNPAYLNFDGMGGDCTNFASQCIFAGAEVMNYKPVFGWYYKNSRDRTPSWTGVPYLNNFIINNRGEGPFGTIVEKNALNIGDLVQLKSHTGEFYHSLIVVGKDGNEIFIAAHTFDAFFRPLSSYSFSAAQYIRLGIRKYIQ